MAQSVHEYFVVYEYYCPSSVCNATSMTSFTRVFYAIFDLIFNSIDTVELIGFFYKMVLDVRAKIISYYLSSCKQTEILNKLKVDKVNRMLVYWTVKRYNDTRE